MNDKFDTQTIITLIGLGWTLDHNIASIVATIRGTDYVRTVTAMGSWLVFTNNPDEILGSGHESHPCYAAMEANECFWAKRDGKPWRGSIAANQQPAAVSEPPLCTECETPCENPTVCRWLESHSFPCRPCDPQEA